MDLTGPQCTQAPGLPSTHKPAHRCSQHPREQGTQGSEEQAERLDWAGPLGPQSPHQRPWSGGCVAPSCWMLERPCFLSDSGGGPELCSPGPHTELGPTFRPLNPASFRQGRGEQSIHQAGLGVEGEGSRAGGGRGERAGWAGEWTARSAAPKLRTAGSQSFLDSSQSQMLCLLQNDGRPGLQL